MGSERYTRIDDYRQREMNTGFRLYDYGHHNKEEVRGLGCLRYIISVTHRRLVFVILAGLLSAALYAAPVTNADIEKLLAAGMGDEVILNVIAGGEPHFDTSPEALIVLKQKGASQAVLATITKRQASGIDTSATAAPAQTESAKLTGKVVDCFGRPIAGVSVSIDNTTFATQSNEDGRYSLPYVPGTVKVVVKKDGWYSAGIELQIATASKYPVSDMKLVPVPPGSGIYYLSRNGLLALATGRLNVQDIQQGGGNLLDPGRASMVNVYSVQANPTLITVPAGSPIVLLDNDGVINECFRTVDRGVFYRRQVMGLGLDFRHEYTIVPENDIQVAPGVWWREMTLGPGDYVLVTSGQKSFKEAIQLSIGGAQIGDPVYAFRVALGAPEAFENNPSSGDSDAPQVDGTESTASSASKAPPGTETKEPAHHAAKKLSLVELLAQPTAEPQRPDLQFANKTITIVYPAEYTAEDGTGPYAAFFFPPGSTHGPTNPAIWVSVQSLSLFSSNKTLEKVVKETRDSLTVSLDGMTSRQYGPLPTTLAGSEAKVFLALGSKNGIPMCYGFTIAIVKKHIVSVAFEAPARDYDKYWPSYLRMCRSLQLK